MIFIQKQILLLLTLLSAQESQFQQRENLKSVLLPGASSPGPLTGTSPVPRWGPLEASGSYFLLFSCYLKSFWQPWLLIDLIDP